MGSGLGKMEQRMEKKKARKGARGKDSNAAPAERAL